MTRQDRFSMRLLRPLIVSKGKPLKRSPDAASHTSEIRDDTDLPRRKPGSQQMPDAKLPETNANSNSRLGALARVFPGSVTRAGRLFARPASLGKNHPPLVGRTPKRAGQFEGFVTRRAGGHLARLLQGVRCGGVPVESIR